MNRSSSGIPGFRGRGRSSGWNRRPRLGRLQPTIVSSSPSLSSCFFAVRDNAGASAPAILLNLGDQKAHKMVKFCVHQCTQTARRYEAPSLPIVRRHRARERGMTIDERLERLTGRHEALTQTVELMAAENRERDRM